MSDTYLSAFRTTEQVGQPGQQFVKVDHDVRAGGFDALADEQDASGECRQAPSLLRIAAFCRMDEELQRLSQNLRQSFGGMTVAIGQRISRIIHVGMHYLSQNVRFAGFA